MSVRDGDIPESLPLPGTADSLSAALAEHGVPLAELKRIILTHQDIDHIGSLHELVAGSRARVLTSAIEAPFIDGREHPRFARPEVLAQRPELRPLAAAYQPTAIDEMLDDGVRLELAGGVRVVLTPGHTPGHLCLYLERSRTLVAGDALTAEEGRLSGPNPAATQDMAQASLSVQKLAALDVATIVCYHGGTDTDDAGGQLRRVAQELAGVAEA